MDNEFYEEPPSHGFKLPLDYVFPVNTKQAIDPKPRQALALLPLSMRYMSYYVGTKIHKRRPIMDYFSTVSAQRIYGCPIGGIGGGTIGRGFKGEFCRFNLFPGAIHYNSVPECQFIVNIRDANNTTIFQSVMSTYEKPKKAPQSWEWNLNGSDCEYTALYPRAWTSYNLSKYGIKLVCKQVSPVIPHNYKDSSLPCVVFVWSAKNVCSEKRTVSITFTWKEIITDGKKHNVKLELERYSETYTSGISLEQKIDNANCTFTIAKKRLEDESIHDDYCMFNTRKQSGYVWQCLKERGHLKPEIDKANVPPKDPTAKPKDDVKEKKMCAWDGIGLSSSVTLEPDCAKSMEFCLSWDMPVIQFRKNEQSYKRYYTKFFGHDGLASAGIAAYALTNYRRWERELDAWQQPILNNGSIPDWLKSALMNELYYIADGGTIWFDTCEDYPDTDPRSLYGVYGYLEGHEYRMYTTYDVHFYASFALAQLWPNLQVVVQHMFLDTIQKESNTQMKALYDGRTCKRKVKNSVPHDLGDPDEAPFTQINAYNVHDVSEWRDLNCKFILQSYRDYRLLKQIALARENNDRYQSLEYIDDVKDYDLYQQSTNTRPTDILGMLYSESRRRSRLSCSEDTPPEPVWGAARYAEAVYPVCAGLVRRMREWDADGDGLIENTGTPDQTFDAWVMSGPSAYCGGLWLTALFFVKSFAQLLNKPEDEAEFDAMLKLAVDSYEKKIWNGTYYSFDSLPSNKNVVMAAQLCGQWYMRAAGFSYEILPRDHVQSALRTIYENNVLKFRNGALGAVNGYIIDKNGGKIDYSALQSEEMWTGVTYGLAALMIHEGMREEAWKTAGGLYDTMSREMGLSFETPEAITENGNHRSVAYMRPLSVWAMYLAINTRNETLKGILGDEGL